MPITDIPTNLGRQRLALISFGQCFEQRPSEAHQVSCRRVWIFLERFLVFLDHLKRGADSTFTRTATLRPVFGLPIRRQVPKGNDL